MIKVNGHVVKPTVFPDGTSQVWHLPKHVFKEYDVINRMEWWFESEAELMHLAQLVTLMRQHGGVNTLFMPYFPYARQDKEVDNDTTFALYTFLDLLRTLNFYSIGSVDVHFDFPGEIMPCENYRPKWVDYMSGDYDTVIFPDKGAARRYSWIKHPNVVIGEKIRDQATGKITHYETVGTPTGTALVIDDLCDGGATFSILAQSVSRRVETLDLYVTHGIFSRGINILLEDYDHVYTTNSFFGHTIKSDTIKKDLQDAASMGSLEWTTMYGAHKTGKLIIEPLYA